MQLLINLVANTLPNDSDHVVIVCLGLYEEGKVENVYGDRSGFSYS